MVSGLSLRVLGFNVYSPLGPRGLPYGDSPFCGVTVNCFRVFPFRLGLRRVVGFGFREPSCFCNITLC